MERRLYLYTRADTITDTASQFLDFALSTEADGVIEKSGYIGLGISRITQDNARERMQATVDVTTNAFELDLALPLAQTHSSVNRFSIWIGCTNIWLTARLAPVSPWLALPIVMVYLTPTARFPISAQPVHLRKYKTAPAAI